MYFAGAAWQQRQLHSYRQPRTSAHSINEVLGQVGP